MNNSNEDDSGVTRVNVDFSEPLRIDDRHSGDGRKTPKNLSAQVVEEFFKALKTGCAYETRQLRTYDALVVALMIFLPIAWCQFQ